MEENGLGSQGEKRDGAVGLIQGNGLIYASNYDGFLYRLENGLLKKETREECGHDRHKPLFLAD
jgi:hypothetical protein